MSKNTMRLLAAIGVCIGAAIQDCLVSTICGLLFIFAFDIPSPFGKDRQ